MNILKKVVLIMSVPFILHGCFSNPTMVKSDFWKDKTLKIGVYVDYIPAGIFAYNKFKNILGDENYKGKDTQFEEYLKNLDMSNFMKIGDEIVERLNKQGFKAKKITALVKPKYVNDLCIDFAPLAKKENVDVLIRISIYRIGVFNQYDKRNNLIKTEAIFIANRMMNKMQNGKMLVGPMRSKLWSNGAPLKENFIPLDADWNQPPDYPKVTEALNKAMDNALEYLLNSFFQNAPKVE